MATRQMITQANVVAQRIRGALMPLSKGINTAAAFVFTQYNSLVFSFRSTFAEPLRIASLVIPEAAPEVNGGIEQVL